MCGIMLHAIDAYNKLLHISHRVFCSRAAAWRCLGMQNFILGWGLSMFCTLQSK